MESCLICDDHAMLRLALAGAIKASWPEARIATAADYPSAMELAKDRHDLILCDLFMPGADPVQGVRDLVELAPQVPLLVISGSDDDHILLELFDLPIAGFLPKNASGAIIDAAIRLVLAGGRYLPPRIVELANGKALPKALDGSDLQSIGISRLTDRQLQVLKQLARGLTNKEIARDLALSPATVKLHVAAIIAAMATSNRTEAAYRARALGII